MGCHRSRRPVGTLGVALGVSLGAGATAEAAFARTTLGLAFGQLGVEAYYAGRIGEALALWLFGLLTGIRSSEDPTESASRTIGPPIPLRDPAAANLWSQFSSTPLTPDGGLGDTLSCARACGASSRCRSIALPSAMHPEVCPACSETLPSLANLQRTVARAGLNVQPGCASCSPNYPDGVLACQDCCQDTGRGLTLSPGAVHKNGRPQS